MIWLVIRKLVQGAVMVFAVSTLTFALLSAAGGDAFSALRENPHVSKQTIENLGRVYGLDRSFAARYAGWLADVVRGNLGESFYFHLPVSSLIWSRLLNTILLAVVALIISCGLAFILSILSVRFRSKSLNALIHGIVLLTSSTPRIVLALIALAASLWLSVPVLGAGANSVASLLLGAIALAAPIIALFLTQAHESLSQAMREDFIQLARAKGLDEWTLIFRHALRPALNPVLTIFGLSLGALLSGSVIVETVLNRPGIGELIVTGVRNRDVPLIMAVVLFSSLAVWLGNFTGEILQLINDKRLRSNQET
jgi:peptide/nickel transport system permease protein